MINRDGRYTVEYQFGDMVAMLSNSVFIYHRGLEERSCYVDEVMARNSKDIKFFEVNYANPEEEEIVIADTGRMFNLRSSDDIRNLLSCAGVRNIYLDASGLPIKIIAPLIKQSLLLMREYEVEFNVVYVEPRQYNVKRFSEEGSYHKWAEDTNGISPLPGLSCIYCDDEAVLIPFLGFQGGRLAYILSQLQVDETRVMPVIGVSGYRAEYPFYSYYSNRRPLQDTDSWANVRFAMAGSIVDAFLKLMQIHRTVAKGGFVKVAPIGTKPHAIAAILFACLFPRTTELVYDNPKHTKVRTNGVARISVTNISRLIKEAYH